MPSNNFECQVNRSGGRAVCPDRELIEWCGNCLKVRKPHQRLTGQPVANAAGVGDPRHTETRRGHLEWLLLDILPEDTEMRTRWFDWLDNWQPKATDQSLRGIVGDGPWFTAFSPVL